MTMESESSSSYLVVKCEYYFFIFDLKEVSETWEPDIRYDISLINLKI